MGAYLTALCLLATVELPDRMLEERYSTCLEVAQAVAGDPLLVSLAWEESRFNAEAKSRRGALGPLQAMPAHWCPGGKAKGCDLVAAGLGAVVAWKGRFPGVDRRGVPLWLCHYNAGNECGGSSRDYARRIWLRARRWERALKMAGLEPAT
jgi:hypothetical protein